jgi:hypothetical protein
MGAGNDEGDHWGPAEEIAELEEELLRAELEQDDAETHAVRQSLALVLLEANDPDRAVPHFEWLVAQAEGDPGPDGGPDGDDALNWRGFVGRALTEARRYAEAETVLAALVEDRTRVYGPADDRTLVARGNLCRAIGFGGRPNEAIELAERLLDDRVRLLGPDHPSTLDTRGHLARFHDAAGDPGSALALLTTLLEDRIRVLGEDHPVVDSTRHNLLTIASRSGLGESVTADLVANVDHVVVRYGPDHADSLTARGVLAEHLIAIDDIDGAVSLLQPLIADRTRLLGPTAAPTVSSRRLLIRCLRESGEHTGALLASKWLLDDVDAEFGPDNAETLRARVSWLYARWDAGDTRGTFIDDVIAAARTAKRIVEEDHPIFEDLVYLLEALFPDDREPGSTFDPTDPAA